MGRFTKTSMDSQGGATIESDTSEFPPLFPEELWYEVLLRYGLYVGAVFQLICILAVIVLPPLKEGSDNSAGNEESSSDEEEDRKDQRVTSHHQQSHTHHHNVNRSK